MLCKPQLLDTGYGTSRHLENLNCFFFVLKTIGANEFAEIYPQYSSACYLQPANPGWRSAYSSDSPLRLTPPPPHTRRFNGRCPTWKTAVETARVVERWGRSRYLVEVGRYLQVSSTA